jgi:hypothetical protein
VARVLSGCLARRREDRFATAQEAGWAIEEALVDMGVAASARDVASFVEEQAGDLVGARRFDFGRAGTTGHGPAIPRDLTRLHSGSIASMKQPRRAGVGAIVAACAAVPAVVLAFALSSGVHDARPPVVSPATAVVTVEPEPQSTATVEVAPMATVTPSAEVPAAPPPTTQATPPHAKPHPVVRHGTWKPRSRHD